MALVDTLRARAVGILAKLAWLAPLLGRLSVGLLFMSTGWGKVHSLDKVTHFFESLHIPAPAFNAVLVGYSELICGTLLVVGLATRLATLPLIVSMIGWRSSRPSCPICTGRSTSWASTSLRTCAS